MVDAFTDNRNRTSASIRHRFSKFGGNLAESNAVGWMFERKGVISADAGKNDPEDVGLAAIEAGADDVQVDGKSIEVSTPPGAFEKVKAAMEGIGGVTVDNAEITHAKAEADGGGRRGQGSSGAQAHGITGRGRRRPAGIRQLRYPHQRSRTRLGTGVEVG